MKSCHGQSAWIYLKLQPSTVSIGDEDEPRVGDGRTRAAKFSTRKCRIKTEENRTQGINHTCPTLVLSSSSDQGVEVVVVAAMLVKLMNNSLID
jgi:hypothetical protein